MAYTPPVTFVDGDPFEASELQDNIDDLKIYMHQIEDTAYLNSKWVRTEHVQPPVYSPIDGVQQGVTGIFAQQYSGGAFAQASFSSSYLSNIQTTPDTWVRMPNTSVRIVNRRTCSFLFHWWAEVLAGPDDDTRANYLAPSARRLQLSPYRGSISSATIGTQHSQSTQSAWVWGPTANASGAALAHHIRGSGSCGGTFLDTNVLRGAQVFGLAAQCTVAQAVMINWGFTLEAYWL